MGTLVALSFGFFFFLNLVGVFFVCDIGEKRDFWLLLIVDILYVMLVIGSLKLLLPFAE